MTSKYRIITCDGGGIRGLTSALMLQALDREFQILETVTLVAGNSIGGITAVLLQSGTSIDDIIDIYTNQCCDIFRPFVPEDGSGTVREFTPDSYHSHFSLADKFVLYDSAGLQAILDERLSVSPRPTLADLAPVMVPTVRLSPGERSQWSPVVFHNLPNSEYAAELPAATAAMCTSSAPIMFPPYPVDDLGSYFSDGYVYANNPSTLAVGQVLSSGVLQTQGLSLENIRLLSVGTGLYPASIPPANIGDPFTWGYDRWLTQSQPPVPTPALPYISLVPDMNGTVSEFQTQHILGENQLRLNVPFSQMVGVDQCSATDVLIAETEAYMESPEWELAREWVREMFI